MSNAHSGQRTSRTRAFKAVIVVVTTLLILLLVVYFRGTLFWLPVGKNLQKRAWSAGFIERGLPVPPGGIREGWNDQRIREHRVAHFDVMIDGYRRYPRIGWIESEVHVPGYLATDRFGRQTVDSPDASRHILILGGSVAFGANSARWETTYFWQLSQLLATRSHHVKITVGASGGWVSQQELLALETRDLELQPDVVLFLNGLNDIARGDSSEAIVSTYLRHMQHATVLAEEHGFQAVFALQPCLVTKPHKSLLERHILELYWDQSPAEVRRCYQEMRAGLRELARHSSADFIDCSQVFDSESATTFCDFWHFSDPGHRLLAEHLAAHLAPILAQP